MFNDRKEALHETAAVITLLRQIGRCGFLSDVTPFKSILCSGAQVTYESKVVCTQACMQVYTCYCLYRNVYVYTIVTGLCVSTYEAVFPLESKDMTNT